MPGQNSKQLQSWFLKVDTHWFSVALFTLCYSAIVCSCASLGTHVTVIKPERLHALKQVAVWPIGVIPLVGDLERKFPELVDSMLASDKEFLQYAESISGFAENALNGELDSSGVFRVVSPDSMYRAIRNTNHDFTRFKDVDKLRYVNPQETDALLVTQVSFRRESGGINTYVNLTHL